MCGLTGFLNIGLSRLDSRNILAKMKRKITHRGPDDSGIWLDEELLVGLAHTRLSIVDLSPAGHQPMVSSCSRYVIAYNGEIYNHLALRAELENESVSCLWRGHSDTETLLKCFEAWGIYRTIDKAIGMFAIALWDTHEKKLYLIRDRLGEKPLYYGVQGNTFLFGSELASIKEHPEFSASVNRDALCMLLRQGYISAPSSIYEGINKIMPGTIVSFSGNLQSSHTHEYWSINKVFNKSKEEPFMGSPQDAIDELELTLGDSIERQMMGDVPLGAFLSGGIDSSTIVALMQSRSSRPVKTFTIGFNEKKYNEAEHAKAIATHLGTEHAEYYVTTKDVMDVIPDLASIYSEPFADSSQVPTYLVSKIAKEHVTVALSGDGGDELFSGYSRYARTVNTWNKIRYMPRFVRSVTSATLKAIPTSIFDQFARTSTSSLGDKVHKGAEAITAKSFESFYLNYLMAHTRDPASLVIGGVDIEEVQQNNNCSDLYEKMSLMDINSYLPDDILCKVDRAAMSVSLETRVPLLDHSVVEFASSLPMSIKRHAGFNKWPITQVLLKYVPLSLIDRPKKGFGIPLADWLRGGLLEWADNLLDESKIQQQGFFHPKEIKKLWIEHKLGYRNWSHLLWNILMFQAWYEKHTENH